jgi:beta-lactamase regulating signal transducer with metallopeptidase domain
MGVLIQSAFLKALGWSLIDSLWQMAVLWLLYILLTGNGKRFLAKQRHTLAIFSIAGGFAWFLINLIVKFYEAANPGVVFIESVQIVQQPTISAWSSQVDAVLPFISTGYLAVIAFLFLRLIRQYRLTQKLTTSHLSKAAPGLRLFVRDIAERMGIKKNVQIWLSNLVDTPVTIGFWKPFILLPVAAVNQLSVAQAEAIILHELNHIRRNDYLTNLIISCTDIILFFNPFARALTDIIKKEREHSCDDMVMQFQYKSSHYANALLLLEQNRVNKNLIAIAATGKDKHLLLNRVKRILTDEPVTTPINQKLFGYLVAFSLFGLISFYNPAKVIVKRIQPSPSQVIPVLNRDAEPVFASTMEEEDTGGSTLPSNTTTNEHDEERGSEAAELIVDELILQVEQQKLASLKEQLQNMEAQAMAQFVSAVPEIREFSIDVGKIVVEAPENPAAIYPYVPSTSFSYHFTEDTTRPKKYIPTYNEQQAKESLEKALKGLQAIDWLKLEKQLQLEGKKLNIVELQQELKKAIAEVDWEKVNEEVESSLMMAQTELLQQHTELRKQLEQFQQQRIVDKEKRKKVKDQILQDRLCEPKFESDPHRENKIEIKRSKKVVQI